MGYSCNTLETFALINTGVYLIQIDGLISIRMLSKLFIHINTDFE